MEDYDQSAYKKKARAEALSRGEGIINTEKLKEILETSTQGPWHWVIHDYSAASIQGPAEEWDHVVTVSPCRSCQERAKNDPDPKWKWGRCTCPGDSDSKLLAMAPALAEAYLAKTKYPIIVEDHIYQYDESVFVWFDEAGFVGGAANTLEQAQKELQIYLKNF